jgi:putative transposase
MSDSNTALKTFKYRLYPTASQDRQMVAILDVCRSVYNMCLAERKCAWKLEHRKVTKSDQEKTAIHYRKTFPQAQVMFSQTLQTVVDDLDKAFAAFFRRVKAGETPGYPRFKGREHFHSFAFKQFGVGAKLDGRRLKLYGIGRVAVRWHRPLEGRVKTVRIVRKAGRWYACFACDVKAAPPLPKTGRVVGIDLGISALLTTSHGDKVANPAYYRAAQQDLRRRQRKLARAKRGSKNRRKALLRVQRQHEYIKNQREDCLHKLSTALVRAYDGIALEDLYIRNMVRNKHLSKSILDSGWYTFRQFLTYKAAKAGRVVVVVNPAYTSQDCSTQGCDYRHTALTLTDRAWECPNCGTRHDRDVNAAINILRLAGWDTPVPDNVDPLPAPLGTGKIMRQPSEAAPL